MTVGYSTAIADAVAEFFSIRPAQAFLVEDIARGVRARTAAVRDALNGDERFVSRERAAFLSDKARVWCLASVSQDGPGRAEAERLGQGRRQSQNERLLAILKDGRWHLSKELNQKVACRVNSRMSELRARGERTGLFTIEHRGVGFGPEFHEYRYVVLPSAVAA